jgi:lipoate-protein ligase A
MNNENRENMNSASKKRLSSTWRLLDTPPMTAAENMALDEVLVECKGNGNTPNTIRFLQFSPRAVLVGYHQSVYEEIRREYCQTHGIDINRRITGGGAIFFDENQLGWEVICDKSFFNVTIPNQRLFRILCNPVITALELLGVKAKFRPRNDIEVNGRKISGTGGTESGNAFLFQGTMLVDFDVDTMLRALRIPVEKLKAKEIDSVKDRVTSLKWELGFIPTLDNIKRAIRHGFEAHLGIHLEAAGLTDEEQQHFEKKVSGFRKAKWVDRVNPKFQQSETIQCAYKADAGMVRFTLVVNLKQMLLKNIFITGDFLSFPGGSLYDLESCLRGVSLKREVLYPIISKYFLDGHIVIPGMSFEEFIKPLDQAIEKVAITRYGIPLEHCNLISVVNGSFEEIVQKKIGALLLPYCAKITHCDLRYKKGCRTCGQEDCSIGPAWLMGLQSKMEVVSVVSFEDLWTELMRIKNRGIEAYIGCCCQPFFIKHQDDFEKSGIPGIMLDIDNTTCYELDQAREAYAGKFENQTSLNLDLLQIILDTASRIQQQKEEYGTHAII